MGKTKASEYWGIKRGELKQVGTNQTQMETNKLMITQERQESETPNMDIRWRETQDMGTQD